MSEDFTRTILNHSIARTCIALGYQETSAECIQTLTDVIAQYVKLVGEKAQTQAELSGRCHIGFHDALHVLDTDFRELHKFAFSDSKWNQPFHHEVPEYPVIRKSKRKRFEMNAENRVHGHNIPDHLPDYPPKHTYSRKVKKLKSEQKNKVVRSVADTKSVQKTLAKLENVEERKQGGEAKKSS